MSLLAPVMVTVTEVTADDSRRWGKHGRQRAETRQATGGKSRAMGGSTAHDGKHTGGPGASGDLRITPWSRRESGSTPRAAVAMIMSYEGMVAEPADSTDSPTFSRRRACSAAAALSAHLPRSTAGSNRGLHPLHFIYNIKNTAFWCYSDSEKKVGLGRSPSRFVRCHNSVL